MTTLTLLRRTEAHGRPANNRRDTLARSSAAEWDSETAATGGFVSGLVIAAPVAAAFWIALLVHFL